MRLKDKVAIITGGSRGIGFATADKFLKEGATVILAASSQASADKAVSQLKEKYPEATVAGISPNLASLESVREAFKEATAKYGCVDILVKNAGVSESTPFMEYTEDTFDKVMDLNVKGVFNATRAAAECMVARGGGVILSTSSMVSISGQPSGFAYPASKFAVNGLTVSLARELGPKGIRVNAVAPGITETDMMKAVPKEVIDPMIARIPLRRLGQPEDIANKRIDVLATAIHAGLKATQLKDLDLAYAPPYSSAKDPVNMAGFMIDNISKGLKQWHLHDADKLPRDGSVILLDTRTAWEYSSGHIEGFVNIPVDELRERLDEIEPGKPVYVICQSGLRSYIATRILEGYGYEAYNFAGGFRFYDAVVNDRALVESSFACGMDK